METWILGLLGTLAALWLLLKAVPFVIGPGVIKRGNQTLATAVVRPLAPDEAPETVSAFFDEVEAALTPLGFMPVERVRCQMNPDQDGAMGCLLLDRQHGVFAMAGALFAPPDRVETYMEFITKYPDDRQIITNNTRVISPFKPEPKVHTLTVPEVTQVRALRALHMARVREARIQATPVMPDPGAELEAVREGLERFPRVQARFGAMAYHEAEDVFRLTWPGAIRAAWLSLEPIKSWREARIRARHHAEWRRVAAERAMN